MMKDLFLKVLGDKIISPWWIFLIDIVLIANAFVLAYIARLNIILPDYTMWQFVKAGATVTLIYGSLFLFIGVHRGVIRHTGFSELRIVLYACFFSLISLFIVDYLFRHFYLSGGLVPRLVMIFHFVLVIFFCFGFRIVVRETYAYLTRRPGSVPTVIYGTGDLALITFEAIRNDQESQNNVIAFVTNEPSRYEVKLNSIPVVGWSKLIAPDSKFKDISEVVLAINDLDVKCKQKVVDECLRQGWKLKIMPSVGNWVNGVSNMRQIRDIRIEDLLGRDEIHLNQKEIMQGLQNRVVLVTGAAGSIGSEIVRQLLRFPLRKILLLDQSESALYDLQQELIMKYTDAPFDLILADVTNVLRMRKIFEEHGPDIVFNAAAYKHVPMMEDAPYEAVRVNIGGTKCIADLAVEFEVDKFVMVSTDKAVNPTNVMGASKKISEMYIQSLAQMESVKTSFITTRFGNVLGSNGSVLPLFKRQIEQGGPVTVTHPEITRYFMTIPEACQLVLQAAFMGKGGEVFIFDMGEPVKIINLAKKMIQLSGLVEGEDIDIIFTGLRPGEKLYEELLSNEEAVSATIHEKIMVGKVKQISYDEMAMRTNLLLELLIKEKDEIIVSMMREMLPEFKPQNERYRSFYTVLDNSLHHRVLG
ncbi:nucleoside-diphosphate sugar epimerase/dehydratase [Marinilabiliaceae bacterium ANBcel2]|nr:nucleoside-diphosphate sugar epimerase/dehydratase [Marinilabiliaceae bacterium ANBcel2]